MIKMSNYLELINKHRRKIMGLAALLIYAFHGWQSVFSNTPGLYEIENIIRKNGDVGVDIFLFLSGMGLVYSINKSKSIKDFYQKRIKRILIPYLITSILYLIAYQSPMADKIKAIFGYYFIIGQLNIFLWFFFAILILYLLFPIYYRYFTKARNKFLFTISTILIWLIIIYSVKGFLNPWFYIFFNRIPIFIFGIYFNYYFSNNKIDNPIIYILMIPVLFISLYLAMKIKEYDSSLIVPYTFDLIYFFLAISITILSSKIFEYIPGYICNFFGAFTFEFYCQQAWTIELLEKMLENYPTLISNIIIFVFTTIISYLVYLINNRIWKK